MPNESLRLFSYAIFGAVLFVALHWGLDLYARFAVPSAEAPSVPTWYALSLSPLSSFASVAPAFTIGWLAHRKGFALGALVGAMGSLAQSALFSVIWSNVMAWGWLLAHLLSYALGAAIISSLAGAAGELFRRNMPSNYSSKRTREKLRAA